MPETIQTRRDTAANWTAANPVLAVGEQGLETDTLNMKFGDGVAAWNDLSYALGGVSGKDFGTISGTVTEGNDSRITGTDVDLLDAADDPDGTETVAAKQSGAGKKMTTAQILGTPARSHSGHEKNVVREFCGFWGSPQGYSAAADGAMFGSDKAVAYFSGTGASVTQAGGSVSPIILKYGAALCDVGTTTSGRAGVYSTLSPFYFVASSVTWDVRVVSTLQAVPSGAQDFNNEIGIVDNPTSAAANGFFFRATSANANWQAVARGSSTESTEDTGIAVSTTTRTFRVVYNPTADETTYYINGALVATIDNTNQPAGLTAMLAGGGIRKTAGTTSRSAWVTGLSIEIADANTEFQYL